MSLSPEMKVVLLMLKTLKMRPLAEGGAGVEAMRRSHAALARVLRPLDGVRREQVDVAGVPAEWLLPRAAEPGRTLLYLHGGGYVAGSVDSHRGLTARLADACRARVLALDYRLAPEAPFPAAVEDAVAACRWLREHGTRPERLVLAGDSAGGGLVVATLVALRDAGEPLPAGGVCLSPWVDMEGLGPSMRANADTDPIVDRDSLLQMASVYLAGADPRHPLAAPIYADLHGLPPLLLVAGTSETLLDDTLRLAERARLHGVTVTLDLWDHMIHAWPLFAPMLPEGQRGVDRVATFAHELLALRAGHA